MASLYDEDRPVSMLEFRFAEIAADLCGLNGEVNRLVADPTWLMGWGSCATPDCEHRSAPDEVYCGLCQDVWQSRLDSWDVAA